MPPSHAPGFAAAPARLVEAGRPHLGRFDGPPGQANLLDAPYRGLPRALRRLRLKEWQALQLASPRLFVNLALFDAKLMGLVQAKVYDRARGVKHLFELQRPPGTLKIADQLLDSTNRFAGRRGALAFSNHVGAGRIDVELDVPAGRHAPAMRGALTVHTDRGASQVVCLPFPGAGAMYSHKGMFPVDGELVVDGEVHRLAATDTLALLDDHKGYYPYVMKWDWVTSATFDAAGVARGFNLTRNQCREPETYNENCAWLGDRVGRLPAVTFTRERPRQPGERWIVRDAAGRVEVTFTPDVPGDVAVNALIVRSKYRGPFGTFHGRLAPEGLDAIEIDGWFGMGEEFWLRC